MAVCWTFRNVVGDVDVPDGDTASEYGFVSPTVKTSWTDTISDFFPVAR